MDKIARQPTKYKRMLAMLTIDSVGFNIILQIECIPTIMMSERVSLSDTHHVADESISS